MPRAMSTGRKAMRMTKDTGTEGMGGTRPAWKETGPFPVIVDGDEMMAVARYRIRNHLLHGPVALVSQIVLDDGDDGDKSPRQQTMDVAMRIWLSESEEEQDIPMLVQEGISSILAMRERL